MPQKLTTTACFIQEESSGGRQGCSGKFLRHFMAIRFALSIDGLHLTPWRPCWSYNIKEYVIT